MKLYYFPVLVLVAIILFSFVGKDKQIPYPEKLSEFGFFQGDIALQQAAEGVMPYSLNTPLFSDYADKLRFIKLPDGAKIPWNDRMVLDFPVGTSIAKTFYYPIDARNPDKGRRLIETRVLIHEAEGWKALPYIWNEAQTEAILDVAGDRKWVSWIDKKGKKQSVEYAIPNMNQCKSCHSYDGKFMPIGPSVRQLNGSFSYADGEMNQLEKWEAWGWFRDYPGLEHTPEIAVWDDPATGDLNARARAWLDINCAHCHNPKGPAGTSGFFLDIHQDDPAVYGVMKTPIAAGRGSGGRDYDIVPGKPNKSILYYRLVSTDPGIMMPELGRKLAHKEGIELIRDWIKEME